ncbi:MAG: hypothetical protein KDA69_03615 [Planctomycetaceae bacterium]|nr:hypothetical protein [Planctomycetaceae bacterium]MCA9043380.1 hypothetical protein [Planctomycetaceae bacterium]
MNDAPNENSPTLNWWQAAWRAMLWLVGIVLVAFIAGAVDDSGGLGIVLTLFLLVVSALVHKSVKVPLVIGVFVIAGFVFLASMLASGLARFR